MHHEVNGTAVVGAASGSARAEGDVVAELTPSRGGYTHGGAWETDTLRLVSRETTCSNSFHTCH
jgi:hypothetical protein